MICLSHSKGGGKVSNFLQKYIKDIYKMAKIAKYVLDVLKNLVDMLD